MGSTASEVEGEERPRRDYISRLVKSTRARGNDTGGGVRVALGGRDKSVSNAAALLFVPCERATICKCLFGRDSCNRSQLAIFEYA